MRNLIDLTGKKFFRLTVIKRVLNDNNQPAWLCKCDCGNEVIVRGCSLRDGLTKSCGCLRKDKKFIKDKKYMKDIYSVFLEIKNICENINHKNYKFYGKRGIKICNEWSNDFQKFYDWAINNGYKKHYHIKRFNDCKNFEPTNCFWSKNYKRNFRDYSIEYNNEIHNIREWSKILNIRENTLNQRINKLNWSVRKAFTTPTRSYNK